MRAIQISQWGGPEVLREVELPRPEPGPGQALVRVTRCGVNFADLHAGRGTYVAQPSLPFVPGSEVAGVRADTGERVVALTGGTGGYAEWALAAAERTFPIPDGLDDGTALALLIQGSTAWHVLRTAGHLAAGESVLVHSGAGGVGSLAVQLARPLGAARVLASASSEQRRALALELGADVALDPDPEQLTERLLTAAGAGLDLVIDMTGGAVFEASLRALAPFGRIVVCGISGEEPNRVSTGHLLRHSRAVVGFYLFHLLEHPERFAAGLGDLFARAAAGSLRVVLGGTYPLSEAARAHEDLRARRSTGKVLLDPAV